MIRVPSQIRTSQTYQGRCHRRIRYRSFCPDESGRRRAAQAIEPSRRRRRARAGRRGAGQAAGQLPVATARGLDRRAAVPGHAREPRARRRGVAQLVVRDAPALHDAGLPARPARARPPLHDDRRRTAPGRPERRRGVDPRPLAQDGDQRPRPVGLAGARAPRVTLPVRVLA